MFDTFEQLLARVGRHLDENVGPSEGLAYINEMLNKLNDDTYVTQTDGKLVFIKPT